MAKSDKKIFTAVMYIISLAALLEYILIFELLPGLVYGFIFLNYEFFSPSFLYSLSPDDFSYIMHIIENIASITISLSATFVTALFLVLCLKKFAVNHSIYSYPKENISFKFKLPEKTPFLLISGICIVQLSLFVYLFFNFILYYFFGITTKPLPAEAHYMPSNIFGIILYFITTAVIPAFTEEFIYRFLMLNALKKYGNAFAIIITSVIFGLAHARVNAFIFATAIGLLSAYIAIKTKSIWFSIILHVIINANSLVFQYIAVLPLSDETYNIIYFSFLSVISAVSLIYLLMLIIKRKRLKLNIPENYTYIEKKRKLLFFFNAAALIFIVFVIYKSTGDYSFYQVISNNYV